MSMQFEKSIEKLNNIIKKLENEEKEERGSRDSIIKEGAKIRVGTNTKFLTCFR